MWTLKYNQHNLQKETHRYREQTDGSQGAEPVWEGKIGSLGLAEANYYMWDGYKKSYCVAQGPIFNILW